jgi:outer membrane protein with glycine zipper
MLKHTSFAAVLLASAAFLTMGATAQQGPGGPAEHKTEAHPGGGAKHVAPGSQGGHVTRPGPGGGTTAGHPGGGPGRYAHGGFPAHNFGGHVYHGRLAWERGHWRHEMHNGRYGWWWDVGGAWYFYPALMEGPPTYVSEVEFMDDAYADPDAPGMYPPPPAAVGYPPPDAAYPPPPPPPPGQEAVGGALGGALLGGLLGGALTGRPGGAIAGAVVGGTTGAVIGAEAERRRSGYYWWRGACYYRYPSGEFAPVAPNYC